MNYDVVYYTQAPVFVCVLTLLKLWPHIVGKSLQHTLMMLINLVSMHKCFFKEVTD